MDDQKVKIRLHILGLPHTITKSEFSHCAFTGKIQRFSPMMRSRGFEVYHYGVETSEPNADVNINVLTLEEWKKLRIESVRWSDTKYSNVSDKEIQDILDDKKKFIGDMANVGNPLYKIFNARLRNHLSNNYRDKSTDIVCLPFGIGHEEAVSGLNFVVVESGIGYNGSYKDFRIFESNAFLHYVMGKSDTPLKDYWFSIPNYYDITEFNLNLNPIKKKIGYFGRLGNHKGCHIINQLAKKLPDVDFVLCGQGNPDQYLDSPNITYKEPIHGSERSEYLGSLTAILCPSQYLEPFCGVNVEAQLCGTPVICFDNSAFIETVENFKTGLRCHTFAELCEGINMALNGDFDRQYIRDRATKLYDMYEVAKQYERAFKNILDIYNGKNGWYSPDSHINLIK
jgi:glycosyltransferase involved in cell wall biosynthesis